MKNKIITAIFALFLAQNISADTFKDILSEINSNNYELRSIESEYNAAAEDIKSTNYLGATNIDFEYHFGDKNVGNKYGFGISQSIDWPGLYYSRNKAINAQVSALEYVAQNKQLELLKSAQDICLEIVNLNKQIILKSKIEEDMSKIKALYIKGFEHGEISILDINKLKIELLNVKQAKNSLIRQRASLIENLKALNGEKSIENSRILSLSEYPKFEILPLQEYISTLESADPEYKYYSSMAEANKRNVSVAQRQWYPSFNIGYKHFNELGVKFNGIFAGISIPIFSNRNKVTSAKATQIANSFSEQTMIISKNAKISASYVQIQSLQEQIKGYKEALEDGSNIRVLKKALEGGQISLLEYLTELKYFIEAETNLLDLEFEYNSILADLNKYKLLNL